MGEFENMKWKACNWIWTQLSYEVNLETLPGMKPKDHPLLTLLFFASVLFAGASVAAQTPEILKVEPPSWWIGSSLNPVRVLIQGRNLRGALVQAVGSGFRIVGAPKINQNGSYMFV